MASLLQCPADFSPAGGPVGSGPEFYFWLKRLFRNKYLIYLFAAVRTRNHDHIIAGGVTADRQWDRRPARIGDGLFQQHLAGHIHQLYIGANRSIAAQGDVDIVRSRVGVNADSGDRADPYRPAGLRPADQCQRRADVRGNDSADVRLAALYLRW